MAIIDNKRVVMTRLGNTANRISALRQELKSELEIVNNPALAITDSDLTELGDMHSAEEVAALVTALNALDALLDAHAPAIAAMRLL